MEKKLCPHCGYKTSDTEAQYCSRCGNHLIWPKNTSIKLFMKRGNHVVFRMSVRGEETYSENVIDWKNSEATVENIISECKKYDLGCLCLDLDNHNESLEFSADSEDGDRLIIEKIPYKLFPDFYKYANIIDMDSLIRLAGIGEKLYNTLSDEDKLSLEFGGNNYDN